MASSARFFPMRNCVRGAAAIAACLAGITVAGQAAARDASVCASGAPPVTYSMEVNRGKVIGDLSLNKEQLTALFSTRHNKGGGARMTTSNWSTVGLTESSLEIITSTSTVTRPARGGGFCADLKSVRLKVGYPELRVYIPREYTAGSCAYDVVRGHEMEHVAITRAVLDHHAPRLEAVLARAVAHINPLWAPTRTAAKGIAARHIQKALEPAVLEMKADHRRRNQAIDGQENYQTLQARCDSW